MSVLQRYARAGYQVSISPDGGINVGPGGQIGPGGEIDIGGGPPLPPIGPGPGPGIGPPPGGPPDIGIGGGGCGGPTSKLL